MYWRIAPLTVYFKELNNRQFKFIHLFYCVSLLVTNQMMGKCWFVFTLITRKRYTFMFCLFVCFYVLSIIRFIVTFITIMKKITTFHKLPIVKIIFINLNDAIFFSCLTPFGLCCMDQWKIRFIELVPFIFCLELLIYHLFL